MKTRVSKFGFIVDTNRQRTIVPRSADHSLRCVYSFIVAASWATLSPMLAFAQNASPRPDLPAYDCVNKRITDGPPSGSFSSGAEGSRLTALTEGGSLHSLVRLRADSKVEWLISVDGGRHWSPAKALQNYEMPADSKGVFFFNATLPPRAQDVLVRAEVSEVSGAKTSLCALAMPQPDLRHDRVLAAFRSSVTGGQQ